MNGPERRARTVDAFVRSFLRPDEKILDEFAALVCNGCGRIVEARTIEEVLALTEDWQRGEELGDDDFCPDCRP